MRRTEKRSILIDCDPGLDDTVAIALAAASDELDIAAITTVAGNATVERTTDNALSACATLGLQTPVYAGAAQPLRVKSAYAFEIWGGDGDLGLKRPRRGALSESAVDFLLRSFTEAPDGSILMCLLGPLTNLAHVLQRDSALARKIDRLLVMGGALGKGNATPAAEFNIWYDPHAARRVLSAEVPTVVVPYDLTRTVVVKKPQARRLAKSTRAAAGLASRMLALAGQDGHPAALHDAVVIACLLWPDLFVFDRGRITVGVEEGPARGQTRFVPGEGPHILLSSVDPDRLVQKLIGRFLGKSEGRKR
jgi:purine nucleosidase